MSIVIDDNILKAANISKEQLLIEIAFMLYEKNLIGLSKAREFCGLNIVDFQAEMYKRNISYYTLQALEEDIETMNKLFPK
jgi:predicted HTH domain antitoxin